MPKPYTLSGAPDARMVEQIDEMLYLLFQETGGIVGGGSAGQFLGMSGELPAWLTIQETDIAEGSLLARVADDEDISGDWAFSGTVSLTTLTAGSVLFAGTGGLLSEDNDKLFWDASNFRLGIGTATPAVPLHVQAAVNVSARLVNTVASSSLQGAGIMAAHDDGAVMASGDRLGFLLFAGARDTAGTLSSAISISGFSDGTWSGSSTPAYLLFETTPAASITRVERMRITAAGLVNIVTDAGLGIVDTNGSHYLRLDCGSDLTADRVLSFVPGNAARTITINGNPTLDDWFNQGVKTTHSPTFAALTLTAALTAANGGTGRASHTAYAVICGGTTGTAAQQSVASVGTSGQVLTSNGAGALPTFQDAAAGGAAVEQTTTATGTQNDFDLDGRNTYLRCAPASDLVFTGFTVLGSAPQEGDRVVLELTTSVTLRVTRQDTGSTDVNRVIWPSTRGQIIGDGGRLELIYDSTTQRWRGQVIYAGAFINVAFNAGDFVSQTGTWTVGSTDVGTFAYQQNGSVLTVALNIADSDLDTLSAELRIALPNSFVVKRTMLNVAIINDSGGANYEVGRWRVGSNETYMGFRQMNGTNWPTGTGTHGIQGLLQFEVD